MFGHIQTKIKRIQAELDSVQQGGDSMLERHRERERSIQLLEAQKHEETLWRQKSRITWMRTPDLNTKFFHFSTITRQRRNSVDAIRDEQGAWLHDREEIGGHIKCYFKTLFWASQSLFPQNLDSLISGEITEEDKRRLDRLPCDAEIWDAIKGIGGSKVPGPDGFTATFYQKYWSIVRPDVTGMIRHFFINGYLLQQINHTSIALIPKVNSPEQISQYRPISLCKVYYKIISKILIARLKLVMPKLVSHNQNAFVPNRHIQDNIILVQQLMLTLKRKVGKGGLLAVKVDMEKAFDKVDWHFLMAVLKCYGVSEKWRQWIFQCV